MENKIKTDSKLKNGQVELKKANSKTELPAPKATRAQLVTLAEEMNSLMANCKILTANKYNIDSILGQIVSKELEFVSSDFIPTNEEDKVFSHEAMEILTAIGIEIPAPPVPKAKKKAKKESVGYTKQTALIDAIKTTTGTREEIVTEANRLLRLKVPAEESKGVYEGGRERCDRDIMTKLFRESAPILLAFGSLVYDDTTKIYSLPAGN